MTRTLCAFKDGPRVEKYCECYRCGVPEVVGYIGDEQGRPLIHMEAGKPGHETMLCAECMREEEAHAPCFCPCHAEVAP